MGAGSADQTDLGGGFTARVAPIEYVVLMKPAYYAEGGSQKHLSGIRSVLTMKNASVDAATIAVRARDMGLERLRIKLTQEAE